MEKFLIHNYKAINVERIDDFHCDFSFLHLRLKSSKEGGNYEYEVFNSTIPVIEKLFRAIVEFIQNDEKVLDCDKFITEEENKTI